MSYRTFHLAAFPDKIVFKIMKSYKLRKQQELINYWKALKMERRILA